MDILNTKIKNILTEKSLKVRPENIKKDVSVLGVTGTYTSDANATANDIVTGKTAYVNGQKITGEYEGIIPSGTISVSQNGTVDVTNYASASVNVSSGGVEEKDVNFYDYDGTITNSYTKSEFLELESFPENPSHEGLTAQGWNWTLAAAKAYVTNYGKCNIGQTYVTDDNKTRIYIELLGDRLSPYLGICVNGTCVVDWGDGSPTTTITGTSTTTNINTQHTYASPGKYVITLNVTGEFGIAGHNNYGSYLLWNNTSLMSSPNNVYRTSIKKIEFGNNLTKLGNYALYSCYSLSSITIPVTTTLTIGSYAFLSCYSLYFIIIPNSITDLSTSLFYGCYSLTNAILPNTISSADASVFYNCYSLSNIIIPSGLSKLTNNMFGNCYSLSSIIIPNSITKLEQNAFNNCYSLSSITIPNSVTTIGNGLFSGCTSMIKYDFTSYSSIPLIGNTNVFYSIQSDCKIVVPDNLYENWITTSVWSNLVSYIIKKSDWDTLNV